MYAFDTVMVEMAVGGRGVSAALMNHALCNPVVMFDLSVIAIVFNNCQWVQMLSV